jgi:general secretion pathway protein L
MTPIRLLMLPPQPGLPADCLTLDADGTVLARQRLAADAEASTAREPCLLAVPAEHVGLHRLRFKARSPAQAAAAAARLVEGKLAMANTPLHIAVSDASAEDDRWVAAVDPARMDQWLARAARHGFAPTAMVPDCLLLPAPDAGTWRVQEGDSSWRVRGEAMAFSAEPALARAVLDAQGAGADQRHPAGEADLARGAAHSALAIDLLQDRYSRHPAAPTGWAAWRPAAMLAALLLALVPLGLAAQALRHELAVRAIHARAADQLQAAAGLAAPDGTAFARARAALAAARAGDGFAITSQALFESVALAPGTGVSKLDYGEDGLLAATIDHDQAGDLEMLKTALAERGVTAAIDATREHEGRLRSVLLLGMAP